MGLRWFCCDGIRFAVSNLDHYALALLGIRLHLDPDYPIVKHFFPSVLADSVFEYRTYGLTTLWAIGLAWSIQTPWIYVLIGLWALQSFRRAFYYRSNFLFWTQAYRESPKKTRVKTRYMEQLILEMERRTKKGQDWEALYDEAHRLMKEICE